MSVSKQKIILFGGSFDPIHKGHESVAAYAYEHLDADRLIFVPAKRSPHKTTGPVACGQARLAMIHLAIEGCPGFDVSDCELRRPEPSYTLDTVQHFREVFGVQAALYVLVGADAVAHLERWHQVEQLLSLCRMCIMHRGGMPRPDLSRLIPVLGPERVAQLERDILATPLHQIDSTEIRARLAAAEPVEGLVAPQVLAYIRQNHLYEANRQNGTPS